MWQGGRTAASTAATSPCNEQLNFSSLATVLSKHSAWDGIRTTLHEVWDGERQTDAKVPPVASDLAYCMRFVLLHDAQASCCSYLAYDNATLSLAFKWHLKQLAASC